ncbi:F-box protein-like protein [Tanacetum coccineum]|uniref:F-box protein-like protein n=1 Tax=Tanacetum coccineum TaxID=301880 RepID=A0ABQ5IJA7_9ASTR
MIKCVSLRVLDLELVSITDKVIANLLSTCKLLENIRLVWCRDLKTVKVKNLAFLCELIIHSRDPNSIFEITDVPVLRMLDHSPFLIPGISKPMPFQMDSLGSVTQLIIRNVLMDDGFFDTINSELLLLENLTIKIDNWAVENWVISSVSLKRLNLEFCTSKQFVITVCTPKLISCVCECCHEPAPIISFSTTPPEDFKITMLKKFFNPIV